MPTLLAAGGSFLAEQFPATVRALRNALGREVGGALAGGFVPLLALSLVTMSSTHATWGVSLLFVGCGVLMLTGDASSTSRVDNDRGGRQAG
jgi:hypothetical protein